MIRANPHRAIHKRISDQRRNAQRDNRHANPVEAELRQVNRSASVTSPSAHRQRHIQPTRAASNLRLGLNPARAQHQRQHDCQRVFDHSIEEVRRNQRIEQPSQHAAEREPQIELRQMPSRRAILGHCPWQTSAAMKKKSRCHRMISQTGDAARSRSGKSATARASAEFWTQCAAAKAAFWQRRK